MERLFNWLPGDLDPRTVGFTLTALMLLIGIYWAVRRVVLAIRGFFFALRAYGTLLGHMDREIKTVKGYCQRLEFALNRDNSQQHRVSVIPPAPKPEFLVPPPLDLNPTVDATDWVEDEKKTEIRPDTCLTLRGP